MDDVTISGFTIDNGRWQGFDIRRGGQFVDLVSSDRLSIDELRVHAVALLRKLADDLEKG